MIVRVVAETDDNVDEVLACKLSTKQHINTKRVGRLASLAVYNVCDNVASGH